MKVAGYIRVSTESQVENGLGIDCYQDDILEAMRLLEQVPEVQALQVKICGRVQEATR